MSYLSRIAAPPPHPDTAHAAMCTHRRAMNLAFLSWLSSEPPRGDVALEIDATVAILRQLACLLETF